MSRYQPTTLGQPSLLGRRELLTSQYDGTRHHALYPTALVTLCGLDARPEQRGHNAPPDCPICWQVALKWDAIDQAMPAHWHGYVVALPEAAA